MLARGEDPVAAARRVAPYTRATHLRDSVLAITDFGLARSFSPCGIGVIDWDGVLGALWEHSPDLCASIEPAAPTMQMPIGLSDDAWRALHPDLDPDEVAELFRLARDYDARAQRGDVPTIAAFRDQPYDGEEFIRRSAEHLRSALARVERRAVPAPG